MSEIIVKENKYRRDDAKSTNDAYLSRVAKPVHNGSGPGMRLRVRLKVKDLFLLPKRIKILVSI